MSKFNDWVLTYYGMLMQDFLDSELCDQISFADLANAFQAGEAVDQKNTVSFVIVDANGVVQANTLTPEVMELAHDNKAVIVELRGKLPHQWFDPQRGWLDLLKEEGNGQADRGTNQADREALPTSKQRRTGKEETPNGNGGV